MILTEKEKEVLVYLRNPLYRAFKIMQGGNSPVADLTNEELCSLYNKMDAVIEDEGNTRRSLGDFDEMYVLELSGAKDNLAKAIKRRGICLVKEEKKMLVF